MDVEQYNEYGEIIKPGRRLPAYHEHRIHQTKDLFDSECSYCQKDAKKWREQHESWWSDGIEEDYREKKN